MDTLKEHPRGVQIGIDIGQKKDPTAIVVAERVLRGAWMEGTRLKGGELHYIVRFLERLPLNTSYPDVATRLAEIYRKLDRPLNPRPHAHPRYDVLYKDEPLISNIHACYIDVTGVGRPVFDLLTRNGVEAKAVSITGSDKVTYQDGEIRLGKALMVSRLQVLLQTKRIHLPDTDEARALIDELLNYEIKVTDTAHLEMGARTGKHDDLATACGLATWERDESDYTIEIGAAPDIWGEWRGG